MVALAFLVQVGIIFALGDRKPIVPRTATDTQQLLFKPGRGEMLALQDPTLFALPNARSFGAAAWLRAASLEFSVFRLPELKQPKFELSGEDLGATFHHFVETTAFASLTLAASPPRAVEAISLPSTDNPGITKSTLQLTGDLAQRPVKSSTDLPSWPGTDLLTNTVVQVLVDSEGRVFSAVGLQPPGSGARSHEQIAADNHALQLARSAQFAPLDSNRNTRLIPSDVLTRGMMIFKWHTEPLPATNNPATP